MKRRVFNFCGVKVNVARDWMMSLIWVGVIFLGNGLFTAVPAQNPSIEAFLGGTLFGLVWLSAIVFGAIALFHLRRCIVNDPGIVREEDHQRLQEVRDAFEPKVREFWPPQFSENSKRPWEGEPSEELKRQLASENIPLPSYLWDPNLPKGTHLCPVCQVYVAKYDHHCNVIGACIGERSMGSFILFLSLVAANCLVVFAMSSISIITYWPPMKSLEVHGVGSLGTILKEKFLTREILTCLFLSILTVICGLYTFSLAMFYSSLVVSGEDSLEVRRQMASLVIAGKPRKEMPQLEEHASAKKTFNLSFEAKSTHDRLKELRMTQPPSASEAV